MNKIYWKKKLWPGEKALISPLNTGFFYGENIFEAVPVYGGRALFLGEHLQRLKRGCDFLRWPFPPEGEFRRAIRLFSTELHPGQNFMIRFNLTQELEGQVNPRFFSRTVPILFATARPLRHDPENPIPVGGKIGVSPWTAADASTAPNRFKISFYLTTRAVFRSHPEWDEVLRLNHLGEVVDGGVSTPLWFDGEALRVPPLKLGGLESVTRGKVMGLCRRLGVKVVEKTWRIKDPFKKGELLFVGSGVGVMSPSHLMGHKINKSRVLAVRLWQRYRQRALQRSSA